MIHVERAAGAGFFPLRPEHEVLNDELALPAKKVRKRQLAAWRQLVQEVLRWWFVCPLID
jgi:hypothetical protein